MDNNRDRLQFLIWPPKGREQRLVKSYEYIFPERGYLKAKMLLQEKFGNQYKIYCAHLEKALS